MRLQDAAGSAARLGSGRLRFVLALAGMAGVFSSVSLPASADPVSTIDRLHFALNEAEFNFVDGGPAFVSPATAVAGLNAPAIRRAYLTRELDQVEEIVTELLVRQAEHPDDETIAQRLAIMTDRRQRLRVDLGVQAERVRPVPLPRLSKDNRVFLSGADDHLLLRLRPAMSSAASVAYRNVDRDGVVGRIITGTHSLEFPPTARLTSGIFGRTRFGEARADNASNHESSVGWGIGAAGSLELNNNFILSGAALYGGSWNQATVEGSNATFDGDRFVADARLDNRSWYGPWLLAPALSLHYEQAARGSFADDEIGAVGEARRRLGRISATSELSRSFMNLDARNITTLHPFVRTGANLELRPPDGSDERAALDLAKANALIGGGVRVHFSDTASLLLSEEYTKGEGAGTLRFVGELQLPFGLHRDDQAASTLNFRADTDHAGEVNATLNATLRFR